jgi:hypothetical protein
MPVQINIGLNKKVGEPNYGSRGASVNLEVELDSGIVDDPDRLRGQIQKLFGLARQSLDAELHSGGNGNGHSNGHHVSGNGSNGNSRTNGGNVRAATQSQARAIRAIAGRQRVNLDQLLTDRFGVGQPEDLSISDASSLIDELKGQPTGNGASR